MNKFGFMIMSIMSAVILTSFASADPDGFQNFTGLNAEGIGDSSLEVDDEKVGDTCPVVEITDSRSVQGFETGNITKFSNSSRGWFTVDTTGMKDLIVDANSQGIIRLTLWIEALNYDVPEEVEFELLKKINGDANRIDLSTSSGYVDHVDEVNLTIYNDDAVITDVYPACSEGDSSSAINDFRVFITSFFDILSNILGVFFGLLTAGGNSVAVAIKDLYVVVNIVGWFYVFSDILKDVIPFT